MAANQRSHKTQIRVIGYAGKIALVREEDFQNAIQKYSKKFGSPETNATIIVPDTMIFTNLPSHDIKDYITGNLRELEGLQKNCTLVQCGGFFPPFLTEAWSIEEQKRVFRPVSLSRGYELLFNGRLRPPHTT